MQALDATDLEQVRDAFMHYRPSSVLFCVGQLKPRTYEKSRSKAAMLEVRSLTNIFDCMIEFCASRLLYCSSGGAVYGNSARANSEEDACNPISTYGELKLSLESLIKSICHASSISYSVLRMSNPYGPGQFPIDNHGVIANFLFRAIKRSPITAIGSLENAKDYIYIDDVSRAIWAIINSERSGVYNIGSGKLTKLRSIIDEIERYFGFKLDVQHEMPHQHDVQSFVLNIDKAMAELEWMPTVNLSEGIARTAYWMQTHDILSPSVIDI